MRLKSRGLGRKELVMDFREYNVVPKDKEIVIEGTITEPVHWDFTIRMCQDDLPGITKVLFKKTTILFLLKAALTKNKDNHWSSKDASSEPDEKPAAKAVPKKTTSAPSSSAPAGGSQTKASDRAAQLAEAKARAAKAKAAAGSSPSAPSTPSEPSEPTPAAKPVDSTAKAPAESDTKPSVSTAPARAAERPKFDAAQPKLPRARAKADKVAAPPPAPKPKRTGAPLAGDDYDRGLKKQGDMSTAPSPASFATGKTVSFGAPALKPTTPKPAEKNSTSKTEAKDKKKTAGSTATKDKSTKSSTDTKIAANGGKKTANAAEGTKS